MSVSRFVLMYCFIMFDLPVTTKEDRKNATKFRNYLLDIGCTMFQYSVYTYLVDSRDSIPALISQIKAMAPENGSVSIISITMRQYDAMSQFSGKNQRKSDQNQLILI